MGCWREGRGDRVPVRETALGKAYGERGHSKFQTLKEDHWVVQQERELLEDSVRLSKKGNQKSASRGFCEDRLRGSRFIQMENYQRFLKQEVARLDLKFMKIILMTVEDALEEGKTKERKISE